MNASIQNKPARNLLLTALVTLGTLTFASVASADHDYLRRDFETLELCATEGLRAEAVHRTRMKVGRGLVGR